MPVKLTSRAAAFVVAAASAMPQATAAQEPLFPTVTIAGSRVQCLSVARVAGFFEYRYRVSNPSTSDAGVKALAIDVSAAPGVTPDMLPTSGLLVGDATKAQGATAGHVPIGLDLPSGWRGIIQPNGMVRWRAPGEGLKSIDPILPGASREDFVLRSTYLPGVRAFELLPDYPHFCCPYPAGDPRNERGQVRTPEDFHSVGLTIGPLHAPEALTPELVAGQLSAACAAGWITNAGVCNRLRVKLEHAVQAAARGYVAGARSVLNSVLNELEAQHGTEPGKHVTDNAYFLLKTNVQFLLTQLGPPQ